MNSKDATFAIYRDRAEIKVAVHSLIELGFNKSTITTFQSKCGGSKDFSQVLKYQFKNGAVIGAIVGTVLGSVFFAIANGELFGSRLIMMLVDILFGGLLGAAGGTLVGIGTPDPAAKRYGQYLQSGGILLSVYGENPKQIQQAKEVLSATGGQDIQLINELKTWEKANLERIDLEKVQTEGALDL